MSSAGPWSVKGIDPKAREIAKDLARRSGMTLGEWLNQMIIEGEPEAPSPPVRDPEPLRRPPLQAGPQFRSEALRRSFDSAYDNFGAEEELARVTRALDAFSNRLEAAEHRSTLAISGIDQSVMGVLSRLDGIEREQGAVSARFEGGVEEVRATQAKLADRVRRMEQEDGPRVEAMKALESALGKVAAQIYEGESRSRGALSEVRQDLSGIARRVDRLDAEVAGKADADQSATSAAIDGVVARINERLEAAEGRTSAAIHALESSFAGLDARLKSAEGRLTPEPGAESPEHRFQRLAADLSHKVEASRHELAEHMRAAADGKLDRMEAALRDLAGHVEAAEKQSADAIDRMGREVVRIAQTLGQRVSSAEQRNAQAVEQVGGEVARIADAMEARMRGLDTAQAAALEKLGGEIGKIAERLAERIAASERRAATAIDEVGDQIARVTDKINQRHERATGELADRIRQSEERTAKLLDEARESLDRRVNEAQRPAAFSPPAFDRAPVAAAAPVAIPAVAPAARADTLLDDLDDGPFAPDPFYETPAPAPASPPAVAPVDDPFAEIESPEFEAEPALDPIGFTDFDEAAPLPATEGFAEDADDFVDDFAHEPAYDSAPLPESAFEPAAPAGAFDHAAPPAARSSTRELIEAARAAARQASAVEGRSRRRPIDEMFQASAPVPPLESQHPPRGLGAFLGRKKKKKESGATLRTVLLASGVAAGLTAAAVGSNLLPGHPAVKAGARAPEAPPAPAAPQQAAATASDADLLAAALAPQPTTEVGPAVPPSPAAPLSAPPAADIPAAPARPAVPARLTATRTATTKPAPIGAKPAARPLASADAAASDPKSLYSAAVRQISSGDASGLEPLRRAANLGHPQAQFYLAKLYEAGSFGLKKDLAEARRWTERAATGGDPKAMHNLGLYYFEGTGGAKNTLSAAGWFQKAANAGLEDSQYNLARLYEQGYGVPQNLPEAYKWYLIAAAGGDGEAKSSAERLRAQLSPENRETAQRSASAFRPQTTALAAK